MLFTDNPEKIFRRFNADRPEDFMGHSLSVSDVIVRNKGGLVSAVFTDIIGFTEVPHFIDEIRQANDIRIVEELEELRAGDTVKLYDGLELRIEEGQQIDWRGWERTQRGTLKNGAEIAFHISETESVLSSEGVEFQRSPEPFLTGFYVVDNLNNPTDSVKKYDSFEDALEAYDRLPMHCRKALGAENVYMGSLDLIQCVNGADRLCRDYKRQKHWQNPEVYALIDRIREEHFVVKPTQKEVHLQKNQTQGGMEML